MKLSFKTKFKKDYRLYTFLFHITLYMLLFIAYKEIVNDYAYMGFIYSFIFVKFIIGLIIFISLLIISYNISDKFIYSIWNIYFSFSSISIIVYYQIGGGDFNILLSNILFLLIFLIGSRFHIGVKIIDLSIDKRENLVILFFIAILLFLPFLVYLPYINLNNLLLKDIYETRYYFRGIKITGLSYLIGQLTRVLLPVLFIKFVSDKKYFYAIFILAMILYLYLCGAFKSYFIGIFVAIFFYKGDFSLKARNFVLALIFGISLGLFIELLFHNSTIIGLFVRRIFFIPPYLDNLYYDYFAENHIYWSNYPLISYFFKYPYDLPITQYFGEVVLGKEGLNANVGIITEGYIHGGYVGIIIHSLIITIVFNIIRSLNIRSYYYGIIFLQMFGTINSFLSTLLLTHGLLFFIIISIIFLKNRK